MKYKTPVEAGYPVKREHSPKSLENVAKSGILNTARARDTIY